MEFGFYYLFSINCRRFHKIYSIVSVIQRFKKLHLKNFSFQYVNTHCLLNELSVASTRQPGGQLTPNKKWQFSYNKMHQCEIFHCGPQAAVNPLQPRRQTFVVLIPNTKQCFCWYDDFQKGKRLQCKSVTKIISSQTIVSFITRPNVASRLYLQRVTNFLYSNITLELIVFGRPFVKRFAYAIGLLSCPVCNVGVLWPNTRMDENETWHGGSRPRRLCLSWRPCCPTPPKKGTQLPIFSQCLLWPNGWMDQHTTWHRGRAWSRRHCVRWGAISPMHQKTTQPPNFRLMSTVAKRLDASGYHLVRR